MTYVKEYKGIWATTFIDGKSIYDKALELESEVKNLNNRLENSHHDDCQKIDHSSTAFACNCEEIETRNKSLRVRNSIK